MHYETGVHAAETGINVLVCIGDLSAQTARGAQDTCKAEDRDMVIRHYGSKPEFSKICTMCSMKTTPSL